MKRFTTDRRRLLVGLTGAVLLASPLIAQTSASFSAAITNDDNWAESASIAMEETQHSANNYNSAIAGKTCTSTDESDNTLDCDSINKYGGAGLTQGGKSTVFLTIKNTGTLAAANFTLTPASCDRTFVGGYNGTGNLCGVLKVTVKAGIANPTTTIVNGLTPNAISANGALDILALLGETELDAGETVKFEIETELPAAADNGVMGQRASQPLTWTFTTA